MKYGISFLLLFFFMGAMQAQTTMKMMSYNIRLDVASDSENRWDARKEKLAALVNYYEPDFMGGQEVQHHQLTYLLSALHGYDFIGVGRDDGKTGGEYSCIFYKKDKYKCVSQSTFWLSPTPDSVSFGWNAACRRVCTYGLFKINKTKQYLWVFNTHFDHISAEARLESAKLIIKKITSLNTKNYPETGKLKVGIVQPNINPWEKWAGKRQEFISGYIDQINTIKTDHPDVGLIILPETALPYYFRERIFEERLEMLLNVCDSIETPLLIGTPDLVYYKDQNTAPGDAKIMKSSGLKYDTYNSAVLFEPEKDPDDFQKHQKIKLVIGSERMPYQEILSFTKSIISWGVGLSSWQIGQDTNIFTLPGEVKFNTAVCYESVYPEFFAGFVNKGAEFSVIITNDGWWGKFFGTYQHNRFAVFRAIENRRWIARCANTGISDFIDPQGNYYLETEINEKANIIHEVGLIKEKTFYTENGDVFSEGCLVTGLLFFAFSFFYRNKQ